MPFGFGSEKTLDGGPLFKRIVQFFQEDDWSFDRLEGKDALGMLFTGPSGTLRCIAMVHEENEQFAYFSVFDTRIPAERRRLAAEYLTRANYGLSIGNFELDMDDGEVRCKTSVDVEGGELTTTMIRNLVCGNLQLMTRYAPGLLKVVFGDTKPGAAVREVEAQTPREE